MNPGNSKEGLFPFLSPQHPFRPELQRFEAMIRARPGLAADAVHTDLKAAPEGNGFRIEAFYWSAQGRSEGRFAASTLSYGAKRGKAEWLEFPADPYLPAMAHHLAASASPPEVLRYVPLRRLTFRERNAKGTFTVGKFKRRSRFREAYRLLEAVHRALSHARLPFRVPAPLGMDEAHCLYFQQALPGRNLADLLVGEDAPALLRRLGALHAALHRVPAEALPPRDPAAGVDEARRNAAWIGFQIPERAGAMAHALQAIESASPAPGSPAFCHGDPDCGQVLVEGDDWSLLDFDGSHAGDPYRDMAMLLASLDYHVPSLEALAVSDAAEAEAFLARCAEGYLEGYFAEAGAPADFPRLAWHRACAELYYLALVLKKDRWHPRAFERRRGRLEAQLDRLNAST